MWFLLLACSGQPETPDPVAADLTPLRVGWQTTWATQGQLAVILQNSDLLADQGFDATFVGFSYGGPLNEGALVFLSLSERESLFVYHVTSDVGGAVPERMVAGFVKRTMTDHIRNLQKRARDVVPAHYRGDHAPVPGFREGAVPLYP